MIPVPELDQESYLKQTSIRQILLRGVKKMTTEFSSIKFLLLAFVCIGVWVGVISDTVGIGSALLLVGIRELPIGAIGDRIRGKIAHENGSQED